MDGKTIQHRVRLLKMNLPSTIYHVSLQKCALHLCEGPLVNYKNGRFCQVHLDLADLCGIIPCGRPVHQPGALTCDNQLHIAWQQQYNNRFSCLSFPGVQRVICRQQMAADNSGIIPALRVELGPLGDTPGDQVVHTFREKSIYCLQKVQWACASPSDEVNVTGQRALLKFSPFLIEFGWTTPSRSPVSLRTMTLVVFFDTSSRKIPTVRGFAQLNLWWMPGIISGTA